MNKLAKRDPIDDLLMIWFKDGYKGWKVGRERNGAIIWYNDDLDFLMCPFWDGFEDGIEIPLDYWTKDEEQVSVTLNFLPRSYDLNDTDGMKHFCIKALDEAIMIVTEANKK